MLFHDQLSMNMNKKEYSQYILSMSDKIFTNKNFQLELGLSTQMKQWEVVQAKRKTKKPMKNK